MGSVEIIMVGVWSWRVVLGGREAVVGWVYSKWIFPRAKLST